MIDSLDPFRRWLQHQAEQQVYFSGTFWFIFSNQVEPDFIRVLDLQRITPSVVPRAEFSRTVTVHKRTGSVVQATFHYLPVGRDNVHVLFSLEKPAKALRPMYHLLARTKGKVHLFPIGHPIVKTCVRLSAQFRFDETQVLRGVSYPSRPSEGGADIRLRPGSASAFFLRLEEERRVLKTARLRAPTRANSFCEFTLGRPGYLSYHKGDVVPLLELITEKLTVTLAQSVRPFEKAAGRFVEFRFSQPLFMERANYGVVIDALTLVQIRF